MRLPYWLDGWKLAVKWHRAASFYADELETLRDTMANERAALVDARQEAWRLRCVLDQRSA